jgi:hypothetical protein
MLRLIKQKPEETSKKENAFQGIMEMPWWQRWLEIAGYVATLIVIAEFLMRWLSG